MAVAQKMISAFLICVLVTLFHNGSAQYGDFSDLQGDYCRARRGNTCCDGRIDACSLPILGTLCYCDQFCNRTGNPDCCPDYWDACLGIEPPESLQVRSCTLPNDVKIPHGASTMTNCNRCTCNLGVLNCETDLCLMDLDYLQVLEREARNNGWNPTNYSMFWGKKLDEGLMRLTGTLPPDEKSLRMHPIKLHYDLGQIPRSFDARSKWGNLDGIRDQGWCASSWALSTVSVAQDRLVIASDGMETVELSPQNLLSCNRRGQQACNGGHVERAWSYLRKFGVVTEECYPYTSGFNGNSDRCKINKQVTTLQSVDCYRKQFPMDRTEFYTTEPAYRIASKEGDIMWEIMTNGPVQALMRVYRDFFYYKDGVYKRSSSNVNNRFSVHSVRLLGWGEQPSYFGPPTKYWLAANSWGSNWGLDGTFRIERGQNQSDIEQFVLAVRSHLTEEVRTVNRRRTSLQGRRNSLSRRRH